MSVEFSADGVPVAARPDYWRQVIGQTFGPMAVRASRQVEPPLRLRLGGVGAVRAVEVTAPWPTTSAACEAACSPRLMDSALDDLCRVDVPVVGYVSVEQDGRQCRLGPGDFAVADLSRPVRWRTAARQSVAVIFPRSLLPLRPDELAQLTSVRIRGDRGAGALVSPVLRQLIGQLDECDAVGRARLGGAMVDLLTVALANRLDRAARVPPESRRQALLGHIHHFIEARLGDPGLSPKEIAAAHHISVRYLYRLFDGRGVAEWIRQRRLARCRADLLDPRLGTQPIHTIAARWGLTNPAHFSRVFRTAYGASPSEYRTTGG